MSNYKLISAGKSLLLIILFFIFWEIMAIVLSSFLFPTPTAVFSRLIELFINFEITYDLISTLFKIITSIVIGSVFGILFGVLMSYWDFIYDSTYPFIDFFRSIPATALFPLFLLIFGIGDKTNIALATWICVLYLSLHVSKGLRNITETFIITAKTFKKSELDILLNIKLREALPTIFIGFRTAVSLVVVIIIVTEMFIGTISGLGKAIIDSAYVYDIPKLYAIILIVGVIGYLLNALIVLIEKNLVHWYGK